MICVPFCAAFKARSEYHKRQGGILEPKQRLGDNADTTWVRVMILVKRFPCVCVFARFFPFMHHIDSTEMDILDVKDKQAPSPPRLLTAVFAVITNLKSRIHFVQTLSGGVHVYLSQCR